MLLPPEAAAAAPPPQAPDAAAGTAAQRAAARAWVVSAVARAAALARRQSGAEYPAGPKSEAFQALKAAAPRLAADALDICERREREVAAQAGAPGEANRERRVQKRLTQLRFLSAPVLAAAAAPLALSLNGSMAHKQKLQKIVQRLCKGADAQNQLFFFADKLGEVSSLPAAAAAALSAAGGPLQALTDRALESALLTIASVNFDRQPEILECLTELVRAAVEKRPWLPGGRRDLRGRRWRLALALARAGEGLPSGGCADAALGAEWTPVRQGEPPQLAAGAGDNSQEAYALRKLSRFLIHTYFTWCAVQCSAVQCCATPAKHPAVARRCCSCSVRRE